METFLPLSNRSSATNAVIPRHNVMEIAHISPEIISATKSPNAKLLAIQVWASSNAPDECDRILAFLEKLVNWINRASLDYGEEKPPVDSFLCLLTRNLPRISLLDRLTDQCHLKKIEQSIEIVKIFQCRFGRKIHSGS
jgi:hypothetical protein